MSFTIFLLVLGAAIGVAVGVDTFGRGPRRFPVERTWQVPDGEAANGRQVIVAYGCGSCHVIPGVRNASGRVGPQLTGIRDQIYIAGVLSNTPQNMALWVRDPQGVNPQTAMPNLGVTEEEARDIAAYLYTFS